MLSSFDHVRQHNLLEIVMIESKKYSRHVVSLDVLDSQDFQSSYCLLPFVRVE